MHMHMQLIMQPSREAYSVMKSPTEGPMGWGSPRRCPCDGATRKGVALNTTRSFYPGVPKCTHLGTPLQTCSPDVVLSVGGMWPSF